MAEKGDVGADPWIVEKGKIGQVGENKNIGR
jgi:hypothetical protein